jgi:hypothetical protein
MGGRPAFDGTVMARLDRAVTVSTAPRQMDGSGPEMTCSGDGTCGPVSLSGARRLAGSAPTGRPTLVDANVMVRLDRATRGNIVALTDGPVQPGHDRLRRRHPEPNDPVSRAKQSFFPMEGDCFAAHAATAGTHAMTGGLATTASASVVHFFS